MTIITLESVSVFGQHSLASCFIKTKTTKSWRLVDATLFRFRRRTRCSDQASRDDPLLESASADGQGGGTRAFGRTPQVNCGATLAYAAGDFLTPPLEILFLPLFLLIVVFFFSFSRLPRALSCLWFAQAEAPRRSFSLKLQTPNATEPITSDHIYDAPSPMQTKSTLGAPLVRMVPTNFQQHGQEHAQTADDFALIFSATLLWLLLVTPLRA